MSEETVIVPISRILILTMNSGEMMRTTAIVSPRARPSASIVPPMMPPRPNGSTTVRIMPQRVAPSASAASRSATGAWENTCRITAQAIGIHQRHGHPGDERRGLVAVLFPDGGVGVGVHLEDRDEAEVLVNPVRD